MKTSFVKQQLATRVSEITYKDINSGGNWAFVGGKSLVDSSDICVAEATDAGGVGFQIL